MSVHLECALCALTTNSGEYYMHMYAITHLPCSGCTGRRYKQHDTNTCWLHCWRGDVQWCGRHKHPEHSSIQQGGKYCKHSLHRGTATRTPPHTHTHKVVYWHVIMDMMTLEEVALWQEYGIVCIRRGQREDDTA